MTQRKPLVLINGSVAELPAGDTLGGEAILPPYVTYDTPLALGSVLTCVSPWVTTTYQWRRDGSDIAGATAATYTLVAADSEAAITCVATGTGLLTSEVTAPFIEADILSGWNTAALEAADMTFSNGGRTVVGNDDGGTGDNRCLSLAGVSTGKRFASVSIDAYEYGDVSICDSADENYVHFAYDGAIYSSAGTVLDNIGGYNAPCDIDMVTDTDNHLVWFRVDGGDWNGDPANDPETDTGGYPLPVSALPYHVKVQMPYFPDSQRTLNVGEAAYPYPPPAGCVDWGA